MAADNFYTGQEWEVDTEVLMSGGNTFSADARIQPLYAEDKVFLECGPRFEDGKAARMTKVRTTAVFEVPLR